MQVRKVPQGRNQEAIFEQKPIEEETAQKLCGGVQQESSCPKTPAPKPPTPEGYPILLGQGVGADAELIMANKKLQEENKQVSLMLNGMEEHFKEISTRMEQLQIGNKSLTKTVRRMTKEIFAKRDKGRGRQKPGKGKDSEEDVNVNICKNFVNQGVCKKNERGACRFTHLSECTRKPTSESKPKDGSKSVSSSTLANLVALDRPLIGVTGTPLGLATTNRM